MSDVGLRKKRLETDAWERHRQIIQHLYLDEGQALDQVMDYMKANHEFEATEQAYKKKLRRWKISKNIPAPAMEHILAQIDIRQEQGKDSAIFWHDRPVDAEKIERSRQRMNREKKDNPEKQLVPVGPAIMKLIRIDTPPLHSEFDMRRSSHPDLPLRLDIPHAPQPMTLYNNPMNLSLNPHVSSIPSFTFTEFEAPMMMDHTPVSATSSISFFGDEGSIKTTQLPLSPILPASDFDLDAMLGIDKDFDQLKLKLSMDESSAEVQRALQRGNKLLQAGSALLPKTNIESMDVSRVENQEALGHYRSVLRQHSGGADGSAIADALRHISQIQANSSLPDLQPETSLADRERLLAGYHFFFGSDSPVYLRQVFEFCEKGLASVDPMSLANHVSMFKSAVQKMLVMDLPLEKTENILRAINTYFVKGLLTQEELVYFFNRIISHHPPLEWWKKCENIRFVAHMFVSRGMFELAEPYLLSIMKEAYKHMMIGDFFTQDQYACFLFETLSNHVCSGNTEYLAALVNLEAGLRARQAPAHFNCLELTCWILLAAAYANGVRTPDDIFYLLNEAELETRQDRPLQVTWHFIDGVTSALLSLSRHLRTYGHEQHAQYVNSVAQGISVRWAMPKLYPGS